MSKSIRIRTTPLGDDKFIKVKIDQDFDFLEILSLKITQDEAYERYCSDYGVIVGRVVVNNGFGVPNAKVSVFIPISEEDKSNNLINGLYPYQSVYSKDYDGVRYNLLGKNFKDKDACYVPVGTLPSKREVLDCETKLEVFEKYYKYTTTTNSAGDYMIFGVPVGEQLIHLDVDLSDIGEVSQKPYELIAQGYSKKQFVSTTQFKKGSNLDVLSQIKSKNTSTTVIPFWGETDNCEIGISRVDFDLDYNIIPTSIMMGSAITDTFKNGVNKNCRPKPNMGLMEKMTTTTGNIEIIRKLPDGSMELYVPQGDSTEINENGVYSFQIPMNLNPVITDEFGNQIPSPDPTIGIPTKAKIRMRVGLGDSSSLFKKFMRAKHLVPNRTNDYTFGVDTPDSEYAEIGWKKIYTTKQFIVRYQKGSAANKRSRTSIKQVDNDLGGGVNPFPYNRIDPETNPLFSLICLILFILMTIVVAFNGIIIPALNFVVAILNYVLSIICYIIFYIVGFIIVFIITFINLLIDLINSIPLLPDLPTLGGADPCNYCINTNPVPCSGINCACGDPILPYIPCIVFTCSEERYAPGCSPLCQGGQPKCNINVLEGAVYGVGQGWCASGQLDHWGPIYGSTTSCLSCAHNFTGAVCNNGSNNGHDLSNFYGFYDCMQASMARSMNLYQLDFYNDYVNGVLYFYNFKFKFKSKKKYKLEVYCDYDCHGEFDDDNNDPVNRRNNCSNRSNLLETCVAQGTGSFANNEISVDIKEGLVKDYLGEKYYPAFDHENKYLLFTSDLICLGSVNDCNVDGTKKIINQLESTTYQLPILTSETDEETGQIEETGADPLLYNIRCTAPQCFVTARNCANIRKICELGIGVDESTEEYVFDTNGNLISTIPSPPNCAIDLCDSSNNNLVGADVENDGVRTELAYCNGVSRSVVNCGDIYTQYTGYLPGYLDNDISNEYFGDIRFLKNREKNSYYFYFGFYEGRTALDVVLRDYFTPCNDLNPNNKLLVKINTTNNICASGNTGEIIVKILNGDSPWSYSVSGPTIIPNGVSSSSILTFSNLLSGSYIINLTDSKGINTVYGSTITEPSGMTLIPTIMSTTTPTSNNGSISLTVLGGNPPYTFNWTPTPPFNQNGFKITGLTKSVYDVTVNDTGGICPTIFTTLTGLTITAPDELGFIITPSKDLSTNYNINCFGGKGQVVISNITGGTPGYSYFVDGVEYTNGPTITGLNAGQHNITIYDSTSGQSASVIVQLTQPPALTAYINGVTSLSCYACLTTLEIMPSGGVPGYTYNWNNSNSSTTKIVSVGAGTYIWSAKDSNGCIFTGSTTVTQPNKIEINNIIVTNPLCYDGNGVVNFDAANGVGPYTYKIFKAASGISYVGNAIPCNGPAAINNNILGNSSSCLSGIGSTLPIGTGTTTNSGTFTTNIKNVEQFYIEVKDSNGCTACNTFTITSPPKLNLSLTTLPGIGIGNFKILSAANGGTTPTGDYNFTLHSVSCSGATLETISTGGGSVIFQNPPGNSGYTSGTYYVNVEDSNNCVNCKNITL